MSPIDMNWIEIALFCMVALLVALEIYRGSGKPKPISKDEIRKDIKIQKDIILRARNPYTGFPCSPQSQLDARTIPNARLQTVFGVNNAFTTRDIKTANTFKATARAKLRDTLGIKKKIGEDGTSLTEDTDADWKPIISSIRKFVQEELNRENEIIHLAELVQFITLKVSIMYLFNPAEEALHDREAIKYVAKTINILWIRSKNTTTTVDIDSTIRPNEQRLHTHLLNLTGQDPTDPTTNPMNFILPAYETMWRAVLRGLLEIYFRDAPDSHVWQQVLGAFIDDPTTESFRKGDSTSVLSALDLVKEILRMYPPTRRVNRRFPDDPPHLTRAADIEKLHRNALLVPAGDPDVFNPTRWLEIKGDIELVRPAKVEELGVTKSNAAYKLSEYEEGLGFMPFALLCPAGGRVTQGFGYRMVGVLIGALCEGFEMLGAGFDDDDLEDVGMAVVGDGIDVDGRDEHTLDDDDDDDDDDDREEGPIIEHDLNHDDVFTTDEEITTPVTHDIADPIDTNHDHDNGLNPNLGFTLNLSPEFTANRILSSARTLTVPLHAHPEPQSEIQTWTLQSESPNDELPSLGTALGSERSDYLSLVYRRVV